jgi:hypothetical protein
MSESSSGVNGFDFSSIHDPEMRRGLRAFHQHFSDIINRQQMEIDAIMELMLEKHVGSLGELKRQLIKVQQNPARHARIHEQLEAATHPAAAQPRGVSR